MRKSMHDLRFVLLCFIVGLALAGIVLRMDVSLPSSIRRALSPTMPEVLLPPRDVQNRSRAESKQTLDPCFAGPLPYCNGTHPQRCGYVRISGNVVVESAYASHHRRFRSMLAFLKKLSKKYVVPDSKYYFYTADTIRRTHLFPGLLVHTLDDSSMTWKDQLFPNPHLLEDLLQGGASFPEVVEGEPFDQRIPKAYFRGTHRDGSNRLAAALLSIQDSRAKQWMDVGLTPTPGFNSTQRADLQNLLGSAYAMKRHPHTDKGNYKYVVSLNGHTSSQWTVYRDFLVGAVVLRERGYTEYWTTQLQENVHYLAFSRVEEIPALVQMLEANATLARSIASAGHALVHAIMQRKQVMQFAFERLASVACPADALLAP